MVAKIKSGQSLKGALYYNEHKVVNSKAQLLAAVGYPKDTADLTFQDKLFRLQDLADRNQRTKTKSVHISLNFPVNEKLGEDRLLEIAARYMQGIGFASQPYLVYQHFDAGHPHIHILTTNIAPNGKRISLHNLGRTKSEQTRKEIESGMGLQRAEESRPAVAIPVAPIKYGASTVKQELEKVVMTIADQYRFTSLPEFNAVLQQFNVVADKGSESSVMNKHNGLRYWVVDSYGNKTGVPIKASRLKGKPTLNLLERRFKLNSALRSVHKEGVKRKVDLALSTSNTIKGFQTALRKNKVHALIRRTDTGVVYGLTLVDNDLKAVFKGRDLGKSYSAAAIHRRLDDTSLPGKLLESARHIKRDPGHSSDSDKTSIINVLMAPSFDEAALPSALRPRKKKKRRLHL